MSTTSSSGNPKKPYWLIGCGVIANDKAANFKDGSSKAIQHKCKKSVPEHTIVTVEEV